MRFSRDGTPLPFGGRCRRELNRNARVSVVIPTRNESASIGLVLADLPPELVTEVIVVDADSSDGTPRIAAAAGARVISESRRGYGRACLTGLANARNPDIVVFLDGDYSDRPGELGILLAPILEGRADITLGSRLIEAPARRALYRGTRRSEIGSRRK